MYKITTPIFLGLSTLIKVYITLSNAASKPILYYKSRVKNCKRGRSLFYKLIHTDRQRMCSSFNCKTFWKIYFLISTNLMH